MIQGGCPLGTGTGGPGYEFDDEIDPSLKFDKPYLLAMANAGLRRGMDGSPQGTVRTRPAAPTCSEFGQNGDHHWRGCRPRWLDGHHTIRPPSSADGSPRIRR